jgi:DNA-binding CsgD family transcriptional regulator
VVTPHQFRRSRERLIRVCESVAGADAVSLRRELLQEIRGAVRFDAYAWVLTDPETSVGVAPLADVPSALRPELPRLIRLKYLTMVNRWTRPGCWAASLHEATGGDLSKSLLWREVLARHDVIDVASVVFRDAFGCWGFLDLWRTGDAAPFSAAETAFLATINQPTTAALRRCQALSFAIPQEPTAQRVAPVVLLLSTDLEVAGQTPATEGYLRQLVPPGEGAAPVPAGAYNVAAQLLAVEAGVDTHPPSARVHVRDGVWLTLRADRLSGTESLGAGTIAVTIEEASPAERADLFARAFGFTAREKELFGYLISGLDTRGVAQRMFLSEHTVQDHLKSIFSKTAVRNRRALLSRALGT